MPCSGKCWHKEEIVAAVGIPSKSDSKLFQQWDIQITKSSFPFLTDKSSFSMSTWCGGNPYLWCNPVIALFGLPRFKKNKNKNTELWQLQMFFSIKAAWHSDFPSVSPFGQLPHTLSTIRFRTSRCLSPSGLGVNRANGNTSGQSLYI